MAIGLGFIIAIILLKYKPTYEVTLSGEKMGYVNSETRFEDKIQSEIIEMEGKNIYFVSLDNMPSYEFKLVDRTQETNEDEILLALKDDAKIMYKYYAVILNDETQAFVDSLEEAEQTAEELNLKLVVESEEYSPEVEAGKIISQDPTYQEDYMVKEKSEIKVIISKGTEKTTVPKVEGMTREEAEQALEEAKLKAEVTEENDEEVEAGIVISQEVEPDTEVDAGTVIKIVVSKGSGIVKVKVPSLIGSIVILLAGLFGRKKK